MAEVEPLRTLRYEPAAAGPLEDLIAPPYDVIDEELRAQLVARSPHNVVEIDLPVGRPDGGDRHEHAAATMHSWLGEGVLVREDEPCGRFARTTADRWLAAHTHRLLRAHRGPGRIRPHERTHPGPKEDRLRLTRATRANLSPIFSLFADADGAATSALEQATTGEPRRRRRTTRGRATRSGG